MEDYYFDYEPEVTSLDEALDPLTSQFDEHNVDWNSMDDSEPFSTEMCDSYEDEHALYSDFHHTSGHTYAPTFTAREDMIPYEDKVNFDISNGLSDPFALYAARTNGGITLPNDFIEKPYLPKDFTEAQLQDACNQMCDVLGIRHLPISITDAVPNAQHSTLVGPFRFTLVDDALSFNPDYARARIEHIGSSDIILSDVAHEIGHGMASIYCGKLSTYTNEKLADFISGFLNCKMGVDIDVARQWFQWEYDPMGQGGYPVSEERWDIESAGYFFGTLTDAEGLKKALQDPDFLKLIKEYNSEDLSALSSEQWDQIQNGGNAYSQAAKNLIGQILKYSFVERY